MAFRVEFRPRAEQDLEFQSLRTMPDRCPVYRQFSGPSVAVRRLLHGRYPHIYKVYFTVESNTVSILHIRHGARRADGGLCGRPYRNNTPECIR